jgi:osmoprotectant transport system permease protein
MDSFGQALSWLADGSHWQGFDGIPARTLQHLEISITAVAIAAGLAIPLGLYIGHTRRLQFLAVSIANVGRAVPSFGILVIAYVIVLKVAASLAFGFTPTVIALVLLAIPPILTNTYVGVEAVDPDTVESARGMGLTEREVLLKLEVPLATGLIMAGVRTSAVTVVATATLSALIGGGTYGRYIVDGFAQSDNAKLIAGSILVAILAILTDVTLGFVERLVTPRTMSKGPAGERFVPGPKVEVA